MGTFHLSFSSSVRSFSIFPYARYIIQTFLSAGVILSITKNLVSTRVMSSLPRYIRLFGHKKRALRFLVVHVLIKNRFLHYGRNDINPLIVNCALRRGDVSSVFFIFSEKLFDLSICPLYYTDFPFSRCYSEHHEESSFNKSHVELAEIYQAFWTQKKSPSVPRCSCINKKQISPLRSK